jgi:CubicO group peptidase (beta-lactamase class C family)
LLQFRSAVLAVSFCLAASAAAAAPLAPETRAAIDREVQAVLAKTGAPSASIAVVKDGELAYAKAYGQARLNPDVAATPGARYPIGSISKQFTAAAVLLLAQDGKLSLDDPVGKYVPGLTEGDRITIRQVLSHTSGYRDFWPQDYVPPEMLQPTTHEHIMDKWAKIPLDFQPGAQWQYSNTGYTIAGAIVEKVSGQSLFAFQKARIFAPLHMTGVTEYDARPLSPPDAAGYTRYALGPVRPAPKEGAGWLFAAGALAMRPTDLAIWNVSQIDRSLLEPASYDAMQTPIRLNDGRDSRYGLGLHVSTVDGRRELEHGGEVSGVTTENRVFPDQKAAVTVLTNSDFGGAPGAIADRIQAVLFPDTDKTAVARELFDQLQAGHIDRSRFTANANAYFTDQAVADFASSLGPLGRPDSFQLGGKRLRGGMTAEVYSLSFANGVRARIVLRAMPDGKVEQFMVSRVD